VASVQALISEHSPDLEHAAHAADDQPLQVELERDPHVHVEIKRVVVGDERLRGGASRGNVEDGSLDLAEAVVVERAADRGDHIGTHLEDPPGLGVDHQVEVALPKAGVYVGRPVLLLRHGAQRLDEKLVALDSHRQLAALGRHHGSLDADPVAEVESSELLVQFRAEVFQGRVQLDLTGRVADVGEVEAAMAADQHQPARDPHALVCLRPGLEVGKALPHLGDRVVGVVADRVGVDSLPAEQFDLGQPQLALGFDERAGFLLRHAAQSYEAEKMPTQ
jgi:hypothetical protein